MFDKPTDAAFCWRRCTLTLLQIFGIHGASYVGVFVMSCSARKAKTSLGYTTAQWYSLATQTCNAGLATWSKTWLVELSIGGLLVCTHVLVFVFTDMQVCLHELNLECLSHMRVLLSVPATVSVVNWPFFSIYRSCFSSALCACIIKWLIFIWY